MEKRLGKKVSGKIIAQEKKCPGILLQGKKISGEKSAQGKCPVIKVSGKINEKVPGIIIARKKKVSRENSAQEKSPRGRSAWGN